MTLRATGKNTGCSAFDKRGRQQAKKYSAYYHNKIPWVWVFALMCQSAGHNYCLKNITQAVAPMPLGYWLREEDVMKSI